MKFTVVGRYEDQSRDSFVDHVEIDDLPLGPGRLPNNCHRDENAVRAIEALTDREGAEIIAVFEGHLFDMYAR